MDQRYAQAITHQDHHWYSNLQHITHLPLQDCGVTCYGGDLCTYSEPGRFYSYRLEATTGRIATLIWIHSDAQPSLGSSNEHL